MAIAAHEIKPQENESCSPEQISHTKWLVRQATSNPRAFEIMSEADHQFLAALFQSLGKELQTLISEWYNKADHLASSSITDELRKKLKKAGAIAARWFVLYQSGWPAEQLLVIEEIRTSLLDSALERIVFHLRFLMAQTEDKIAVKTNRTVDVIKETASTVKDKVLEAYAIDDEGFFHRVVSNKVRNGILYLCNQVGFQPTLPIDDALADELSIMFQELEPNSRQFVLLMGTGMSRSKIAASLRTQENERESNKELQLVIYYLKKAEAYASKWLALRDREIPSTQRGTIISASDRLKSKPRNAFWLNNIERLSVAEVALRLGISEDAAQKHLIVARDFFGRHYVVDGRGRPTEKKPVEVVETGQRGCPARHEVFSRVVKVAERQGGMMPCLQLNALAHEMYPDLNDGQKAFSRIWAHVTRLLADGWLKRERIKGVDYYIPALVDLVGEEPPRASQPDWLPDDVLDRVWVKRQDIPELENGRWFYRSDAVIAMLRQLKAKKNFNPDNTFRGHMREMCRKGVVEAWGVARKKVDKSILRSIERVFELVPLFERDDSRPVSSSKRNYYRLSDLGKRLIETI